MEYAKEDLGWPLRKLGYEIHRAGWDLQWGASRRDPKIFFIFPPGIRPAAGITQQRTKIKCK
jgi:hypothetical protein